MNWAQPETELAEYGSWVPHPSYYRWVICGLLFTAGGELYGSAGTASSLTRCRRASAGRRRNGVVAAFSARTQLPRCCGARSSIVVDSGWVTRLPSRSGAWRPWPMLASSAFGFGVAWFGLGLSEAGNPAAVKTVAEWPPPRAGPGRRPGNAGTNVGASHPLVPG